MRLANHIPPFPLKLKDDEVCCKKCGITVNRRSIMRHDELKHGGVKGDGRNWKDLVSKKRPKLKTTIRLDSKVTVTFKI